ncbi:magnesium transporter MgtE [Candidatus Vecturithrix granuli]|uniref:Magnesium transporter MgtE n=1 Tax=Vecturithrix granuli TaxID=1499967 RepID=A0A081C464_VECG1|nr:magnesium transporter MgtE [Candidatus Vecturithrix granuli]
MVAKVILPDIVQLIELKQFDELKFVLIDLFSQDIAEIIEGLEDRNKGILFRLLPKNLAIEVFAHLAHSEQEDLLLSFSNSRIKEILEAMSPDDRTNLLEELPANIVKKWITLLSQQDRAIVNTLLNYPEKSVGRLLTPDYVDLRMWMTAQQAIERIRRIGLDKETVFYLYVIDEKRTLMGVVSLKKIVLAAPETLVSDLMFEDFLAVRASEDQEEAATLAQKYDLIALPVLDSENRLLGIVTIDDLMDVLEEEVTEDFHKMAAMTPLAKEYLKTGVLRLMSHRVIWLILLLFTSGISSSILKLYSHTIETVISLTFFIPMLLDTCGNTGAQSATLVIRGLATGEIESEDIFHVIKREILVGLLLGCVLGVLGFVRVYISQQELWLSLSVGLTFLCSLVAATLAGSALPLIFGKFKIDPAVIAGPSITTIMDAVGLIIYFEMAKHLILPHL